MDVFNVSRQSSPSLNSIVREISFISISIRIYISRTSTKRSERASVIHILRPFLPTVHSYGGRSARLRVLSFLRRGVPSIFLLFWIIIVERFHRIFERFHSYPLVFEYISLEHRSSEASAASEQVLYTSYVHSYLRSSYGGRSARLRVLSFLRRVCSAHFIFSIRNIIPHHISSSNFIGNRNWPT
jgi:hypothetical protein